MKTVFGLALTFLFFLFTGCERNQGTTQDDEKFIVETGRKVSGALMESLSAQLKAALQAGGPVSAMQACQQVAPLSTVAIRNQYDVIMVCRTALKVRNPGNTPDEIDRKVLQKYTGSEESQSEHVEWMDGSARYYRPLFIQEVCLTCHGEPSEFPADLRNAINMLYPEDEATGYGLREFRGLIRVDIKRAGSGK